MNRKKSQNLKRIVSWLLSLTMITSLSAVLPANAEKESSQGAEHYSLVGTPSVLNSKGDVNGDGAVNASDKELLNKWLVRLVGDNELDIENADVNMDGKVNIMDLVKLCKICKPESGSSDEEETFEQHIGEDSEILSEINTDDNAFKVSLDITASGDVQTSLSASESEYSSVIESDMVVGVVPDFKCEDGCEVENVALNFNIEDSYIENTNSNYSTVSDDFKGIRRFNVFKYFEDIDMLLPIETTYDGENTVTTQVDELGTYCLVDMEKWFEALGVEPSDLETVTNSSNVEESLVTIDNKSLLTSTTSLAAKYEKISERNVDIVLNLFLRTGSSEQITEQALKLGNSIFDSCDDSCSVNIYVVDYRGIPIRVGETDKICAENKAELKAIIDNGISKRTTTKKPLLENSVTNFLNNNSLREDADKYYVVVESDSIESNKLPLVTSRMKNEDICAIVVTNKNMRDHASLAYETMGQYSDQILKYSELAYDFIIPSLKMKSEKNVYRTFLSTSWKEIALDKPITKEYKIMLDDYSQADKFDFTDREKFADTDGDGLIDLREIRYSFNGEDVIKWDSNGNAILPTIKDCILLKSGKKYLENVLSQYKFVNWDDFDRFSNIKILPIYSDPTEKDTDFDGKMDKDDTYPLNPVFEGKVNISDKIVDQKNSSETELKFKEIYNYSFNTEFNIDYRAFYKNSSLFNRKLAVFGSVLAALAYDSSRISDSSNGESMDIEQFFENCGIENLANYDLAEEYNDDDISKLYLGHNSVEYNNEKKDIFFVVVRGTPMSSVAEWSSNFDVGANTDEYYSAMGLSRTNNDWREPDNHKGFDVTANRFYDRIKNDINTYNTYGEKIIYIVGHSRGAAISNILGTKFIDDKYKTFVYTYATPNTTTKSFNECDNYDSIFNIVNEDDMVPSLPMSKNQWGEDFGFTKYGKTLSPISIDKSYENEWLKLVDGAFANYNSNGNLEKTLSSLSAIATKREDLYKFSDDESTVLHLRANDQTSAEAINNRRNKYSYRIYRHCKIESESLGYYPINGRNVPEVELFGTKVTQSPAFLLMVLSEMAAGYMDRGEDSIMGSAAGYFVAPIYEDAKTRFCFSGADAIYNDSILQIGGMIDPHVPVSYYLLSQKVTI